MSKSHHHQVNVKLNSQDSHQVSSSSSNFSSSSTSSVSNQFIRSSSFDQLNSLSRSNSLESTSSFSLHSSITPSAPSSSRSSSTSSTSNLLYPHTPPHSNHNSPSSQRIQPHKNPSQSTPPPSRTTSRNDIFSLSLPQPSPLLSSIPKPPPDLGITSIPIQPSYDQRDIIRLKTSIRLCVDSSPSAILGQGTHGTVYLARFQSHQPCQEEQDFGVIQSLSQHPHQSKPWKLCAVKLSHDIPGSLKETLVLERLRPKGIDSTDLANHPSNSIVGWSGLKEEDECEWTRTPKEASKHRKRNSSQFFIPPIMLVLEYCPGGDLLKFVQKANGGHSEDHSEDKQYVINRRRWLIWSREIAEALAWCKQCNVLVGDLKPQNILLTSQLGIRLSDFNCSTILSTDESQYGAVLVDPQGTGTSIYAAPELVQPPPSPCSYPADIFSLGVTLYFLITAREPYRGVQSAVERMLLISRGAFWQHESAIRWRLFEDGQSVNRISTKVAHTHPAQFAPYLSTEPHDSQSNHPMVSSKTNPAPLRCERVSKPTNQNVALDKTKTPSHRTADRNRAQFYSDASPKIQHLHGNEYVDERIMKLISQMCSPRATDRPPIEKVVEELKSF